MTDIPDSIMKKAGQIHWNYTVGFVRVGRTNNIETADLLGTGILVKVENQHAILTAHHVLEILPKNGRLGLILSNREEKPTIDVDGIEYIKIDRGNQDIDGPDIGFIKLSISVASNLSAKKSFYNLDRNRDTILNNPPNDYAGIWAAQGFIEQLTLVDAESSKKTIKAFCQYGAYGGVADYEIKGKHDYCKFPITEIEIPQEPNNFGGISGGGLWQIILAAADDGEIQAKESMLRGLIYYQDAFDEQGNSSLRCHAYRSIYGEAYKAIKNCAP